MSWPFNPACGRVYGRWPVVNVLFNTRDTGGGGFRAYCCRPYDDNENKIWKRTNQQPGKTSDHRRSKMIN